MRKGCFVCGTILAFFGLVLLVLLPVANWILYPMIERTVILKYLDLKPENAEIWNAWVSTIDIGYLAVCVNLEGHIAYKAKSLSSKSKQGFF